MATEPLVGLEKYRHEVRTAKRKSIIDTAVLHFAKFGYQGTMVAGIAEDANVSSATLYKHYASKQKLFFAAVEHVEDLHNPDAADALVMKGIVGPQHEYLDGAPACVWRGIDRYNDFLKTVQAAADRKKANAAKAAKRRKAA